MDPSVAHALASFALVAGLITIIPGLDTAVVLRSAVTLGRRQAFAAAFGIGTGSLLWGVAAATGVSVLLTASHAAYTVVRIAGAGYLVWMGLGMLRQALRREAASGGDGAAAVLRGGTRHAFVRGLGTNLLNPKVGAFYVAMLPQFIPPHASHLTMGLALAGIHDAEGMVWFTGIILGAHAARTWLARRRVQRAMDGVTGGVLVGFGLKIATERR